jgi:hypothetical protein
MREGQRDSLPQRIRDDIAWLVLPGATKNLTKKPHQQGYAPVAGYACKHNDQYEYKNRYDNDHFIFHDACFSGILIARLYCIV